MHQKLLDLICISHPNTLRLFQRVHEIKMACLHWILNELVRIRIVFVMECEAPGSLILLVIDAYSCIELYADGIAPFEVFLVKFKPHLSIALELVLGCILVKHVLHLVQDEEEIILTGRHYL